MFAQEKAHSNYLLNTMNHNTCRDNSKSTHNMDATVHVPRETAWVGEGCYREDTIIICTGADLKLTFLDQPPNTHCTTPNVQRSGKQYYPST